MKNFNIISIVFFLCAVTFISCDKDELCGDQAGLIGEWNWIESYGGFAGQTLTPESTMSTRKFIIDSDTYREYLNDSLVLETGYILSTTFNHPFSTSDKIIEFEYGDIVSVVIGDTDLEIIEQCFDCYQHKYKRK